MFQKNKSTVLIRDEKSIDTPGEFHLEQNTPNPFSAQTTISFSIPRPCSAKLVVYSILEEEVSILFGGWLYPGKYHITWDGTDTDGQHLKSGGYVYFLETESFVASRRLTIIKE